MTPVERFHRLMRFEKVERPPRWETLGFWQETIDGWRGERKLSQDWDPHKYYELEDRPMLPGNTGFTSIPYNPPFEEKVIAREEGTTVYQNAAGIIYRALPGTAHMPQWLKFPVETPEDWKRVKHRIDPRTHDYGNFEEEKKKFHENPDPNGLYLCGLYGFYRSLMGEVNLAYAFYDFPEIIRDMGKCWLRLNAEMGERIIRETRTDFVMFCWEDMAFKNGPLIGPSLFSEFMTPFYRELTSHYRNLGGGVFMVDSDGNNDVLIPLFREIGINVMLPFEVAADSDVRKVRKLYPDLVIWGGLDKRLLNGSKDGIKREVMSKVPEMWEKGGYMPCLDHSTPPCPIENWEYYLNLVRSLFK